MGRKKKKRNSVKLTAHKRFEKSRSRRIYPAFQNTTFVFCGDWGGASTSTKLSVSARAEIGSFAKLVPLCIACELANLTIFGYSYRMYSVRFYLCEGAIWAE